MSRALLVEPERLAGWLDTFTQRHGGAARTDSSDDGIVLHAADGVAAKVTVPFRPISSATVERPGLQFDDVVRHLQTSRRVALLLVRLGGYSAGVAADGKVLISATGRRLVHARHRAGGSSSNRFARRREGQAREALQAAADTAARVLLPQLSTVDAVVLGGDRRALATLRADSRLAELFARAEPEVLDVPEPRRSVLDEVARRIRCAKVEVLEPPGQFAVTP